MGANGGGRENHAEAQLTFDAPATELRLINAVFKLVASFARRFSFPLGGILIGSSGWLKVNDTIKATAEEGVEVDLVLVSRRMCNMQWK